MPVGIYKILPLTLSEAILTNDFDKNDGDKD
jgi:hypothetical protein